MATESAPATATQLTGCVKWFDNGLNYGFITVLSEGEHNNTDIFVHQSNIQTKRDCFRTLYTGECVQFSLAKSDNAKHPYHAVNVAGYNGTLLHCENPNYRPRGFRGGRGRGNGRFTTRNNRAGNESGATTASNNVESTEYQANTTATPAASGAPSATATSSVETTSNTGARRGRGRGRGKASA